MRRRQHRFAIGDAIEAVVAHHEFFRPARPADQRIAAIAACRAARREMKSMRCDDRLGSARASLDQPRDARLAGRGRPRARRQYRAACEQAQEIPAAKVESSGITTRS